MDVNELRDRPFCAGVLIERRMEVLLGAGDEDAWDGRRVPLGASAGGGQEPGETPPDCAHREALEELGCGVELLHAETTFVERRPGSIEGVLRFTRTLARPGASPRIACALQARVARRSRGPLHRVPRARRGRAPAGRHSGPRLDATRCAAKALGGRRTKPAAGPRRAARARFAATG
ncbi:MAG: NUDIX domain-containing protein [Actinobacteria bacterium]|nr:NUDIX domain-containing protein [Actinomycetota bacterium]